MKSKTVDVSIVAANYNNGRYLIEFIDSILNSTVKPRELIIVNDGSTDDSLEILEEYKHNDSITIINFDKNKGLADATNAGLEQANGKYIMRVDPDDILVPNRIEIQFNYLEQNAIIDILGSNVEYFSDHTGCVITKSNFPQTHSDIAKAILKGEHGVQNATTMIKADVLKQYKYYKDPELLAGFEIDYEIFARMLKDGYKFANLNESLLKVRIHGQSLSSNLKINTIRKTFEYRDRIFNTRTSKLKILSYYIHMRNYRNYLISENKLMKLYYLFIAVLFYPAKLYRRIFQ